MKAVVKDNKAYCPKCKERNYRIHDAITTDTYKGRALKYIAICNSCNSKFYYFRTLRIGKEITFTEEAEPVRKQSLMGSSEFEYEPEKLEKKIEHRKSFTNNRIKSMQRELDQYAKEYSEEGYGAIENFEHEVIATLLKEWKRRYE